MAILTAPKSSAADNLGEPPPKGIHLAVCLDVVDTFNDRVLRHKRPYGSEKEEDYEYINRERFIFGVKCKDGSMRKVRSKPMRISLHENSALRAFLDVLAWRVSERRTGLCNAYWQGGPTHPYRKPQPARRRFLDQHRNHLGSDGRAEGQGSQGRRLRGQPPANDNTGEEIPF
jgi:hypothetical protein